MSVKNILAMFLGLGMLSHCMENLEELEVLEKLSSKRTYDLKGATSLTLNNVSGSISLTPSLNECSLSYAFNPKGSGNDLSVVSDPEGLYVVNYTSKNEKATCAMTVQVPPTVPLTITLDQGDFSSTNLNNELNLIVGAGNVSYMSSIRPEKQISLSMMVGRGDIVAIFPKDSKINVTTIKQSYDDSLLEYGYIDTTEDEGDYFLYTSTFGGKIQLGTYK